MLFADFFSNTIRVSISLDQDQARQNVGPVLGPNCLLRLSADDISRQRVKVGLAFVKMNCCTISLWSIRN